MVELSTTNEPEDAAYWLVKHNPGLSAAEQQGFESWISVEENQAEFHELQQLDHYLDDRNLFDADELNKLL